MSENHTIKVVPLIRKVHATSDNLEIVTIEDSYQVVINKQQWAGVEKAAWIKPDNMVPVGREEFSWLKDGDAEYVKVKPIKLRGELSYGFLAPIPDSFNIGDDVTEYLGVKPYEPELTVTGETNVPGPPSFKSLSKYDLENVRKYHRAFSLFEKVVITEKINGQNCRVVFDDGQLFVGSRQLWKAENDPNTEFWTAVKNCPQLIAFCKENPRTMVYGEVYGKIKNFRYDSDGEPKFRCFDILKTDGHYVDADVLHEGCKKWGIPAVPMIGEVTFYMPDILTLAEQKSALALHTREGIVITPVKERIHPKYGRVKFKCVSLEYLSS